MAPRRIRTVARRAFRFEGMDELMEKLDEMTARVTGQGDGIRTARLGDDIKDVLMVPANRLAEKARQYAPEGETGNLKDGIFASKGDPNQPSVLVGVNMKLAPHAHLVEFGHAGPAPAPPHPFMRPAVETTKGQIRADIEDGLRKIISDYSG